VSNALRVQKRDDLRRSHRRKLRESGMVPAVVYGKNVGNVPIAVSERELFRLLKDGPNTIIEMEIPQIGTKPVMVRSMQRDKVNRNLLHIDFQEVNMDEEVTSSVRLETEGPAVGVQEGGVLSMELHDLEIECLPKDIPSQIVVDVSRLGIGDSITVKELDLPAGVKAVTEPDQVVVQVLPPQKTEEEQDEAEGNKNEDHDADA
jgi:large subunit ribosomal protein L25